MSYPHFRPARRASRRPGFQAVQNVFVQNAQRAAEEHREKVVAQIVNICIAFERAGVGSTAVKTAIRLLYQSRFILSPLSTSERMALSQDDLNDYSDEDLHEIISLTYNNLRARRANMTNASNQSTIRRSQSFHSSGPSNQASRRRR